MIDIHFVIIGMKSDKKERINMGLSKYREQFKTSMITAFIMIFCVHGYRFLNLLNSHDSMLNIIQDDVYWQRSLGRFMQPLVMALRGSVCAPWLLCLCSAIFMGISVFLVSIILQIKEKSVLLMLAGIMISNVVMTAAYAAYLPWVDVYAIALFLSLLGVLLCNQKSLMLNTCGCMCMAFSMGFYQAYICVAIGMMMILSLICLQNEEQWRDSLKKIVRFVICLAIAGGVYYLISQIVCTLHHVTPSNTYNGLNSIGDFSNVSIIDLIIGAYKEFFAFLRYPNTFSSIILMSIKVMDAWEILLFCMNIVVCIIIVLGIIRHNILKKSKWWNFLLQMLIIILFPLGVNFVYVMSKGMEHMLMIYAFILLYVLAFVVVRANIVILPEKKIAKSYGYILLIPILLLVWNNLVFSNQIYYKVHLQQESVQSTMTKILYEIEHMESYEYGATPVAFVGNLNNSDYVMNPEYFSDLSVIGVGISPISYSGVEASYLKYYLNNKINVVNISPSVDEVAKMPNYPAKGSICEIDGVIVVKFSD